MLLRKWKLARPSEQETDFVWGEKSEVKKEIEEEEENKKEVFFPRVPHREGGKSNKGRIVVIFIIV